MVRVFGLPWRGPWDCTCSRFPSSQLWIGIHFISPIRFPIRVEGRSLRVAHISRCSRTPPELGTKRNLSVYSIAEQLSRSSLMMRNSHPEQSDHIRSRRCLSADSVVDFLNSIVFTRYARWSQSPPFINVLWTWNVSLNVIASEKRMRVVQLSTQLVTAKQPDSPLFAQQLQPGFSRSEFDEGFLISVVHWRVANPFREI